MFILKTRVFIPYMPFVIFFERLMYNIRRHLVVFARFLCKTKKMKLNLYQNLLLRVPQFNLHATLIENWNDLKESIRYSSPEFYTIIKQASDTELDTLPRQIQHTVWKYFNRAVYRAIPYGTFAGFGVIEAKQNNGSTRIVIDTDQKIHRRICWTTLRNHKPEILLEDSTILFANSSYYTINDRLRYLVKDGDDYGISEINQDSIFLEILSDCRHPISFERLRHNKNWNPGKLAIINQLIELQLLITDLHANIIGQDYFFRRSVQMNLSTPQYIIAERKVITGNPNAQVLKNIPELINLMSILIKPYKGPLLDRFKEGFNKRFEGRHMPLMTILDPQIGINITGNEEQFGENPILVSWSKRRSVVPDENQKVIDTLLLSGKNQQVIDLAQLKDRFETSPGSLPNTIGVLCTIVDDQVIVDSIGGATAVAMMGRYSIASKTVKNICRELADLEQQANPDVLFFDIAYVPEFNAENINRREHIYPLQLSILNFDIGISQLTLDDIYVTVQNDEILLYSKSLAKRVIPRLASAYNFNRSDLPLFKFLCELQFQGLKANLGFNLPELVPDQKCYPRVQYENIVLSPARVKICITEYQNHLKEDLSHTLQTYVQKAGLGRYVVTRTEDRTMTFDTQSAIDLQELEFILKKFSSFYIEECFIPNNAVVRDANDKPYAHQLAMAVIHNHQVYQGAQVNLVEERQVTRTFVTGSEWLYYDIYVHPFNSDYLLQERIASFLKKQNRKIKIWFFIRYKDQADHLRLRMKLRDINFLGSLIIEMADMMELDLDSGLISEFRISRYQRELERYGPTLIDHTEKAFCEDSKYVLALLPYDLSDQQKYQLTIDMMQRIRELGVIDLLFFDETIHQISESFLSEHRMSKADFKVLNMEYKKYQTLPKYMLNKTATKRLDVFESSLVHLLQKCEQNKKAKLFTDMFHMHINRLFYSEQRTHEMIIYYFFIKQHQYNMAMVRYAASHGLS